MIVEVKAPAARASSQLLLLTVATTVAVYAKAALGPLQETMRSALALSDNQMALLQGPALALPMIILAIPLGLYSDRYSRVRLVLMLSVLHLIGSLLTLVAVDFAALFAARSLVGLAGFAMSPAVASLVADLYAPAQRGRAMMVMLFGQFAGVSAAFALGGALVTESSWGADAWRWALFWLSVPLAPFVLFLIALREPPRAEQNIKKPSVRQSFAELWRYRPVLASLMAGKAMNLIALGSIMIWAAPTLARTFGLPPDRVGAIMAIVLPAGGITGTIAGGIFADRCQRSGGPLRTVSSVSILALACVPASLFGVMPETFAASVLLAVSVALLTMIAMMAGTLLIVVIPNELRGLSIAVLAGIGLFLSVGVAPLLVSALSGVLGGEAMIGKSLTLVCLTASLLCAAAFAFGRRAFPRTQPTG